MTVHHVVALAIPQVVAFDLAVPAHVFGHEQERRRYHFTVCSQQPGDVPSSTGFSIAAPQGLDALDTADTIVVPGFHPYDRPPASPSTRCAERLSAVPGSQVSTRPPGSSGEFQTSLTGKAVEPLRAVLGRRQQQHCSVMGQPRQIARHIAADAACAP
jgi:hypothetical protein